MDFVAVGEYRLEGVADLITNFGGVVDRAEPLPGSRSVVVGAVRLGLLGEGFEVGVGVGVRFFGGGLGVPRGHLALGVTPERVHLLHIKLELVHVVNCDANVVDLSLVLFQPLLELRHVLVLSPWCPEGRLHFLDGGRIQLAPVGFEVGEIGSGVDAAVPEADVLELAVVRLIERVPNVLRRSSSEALHHCEPFLEFVIFGRVLRPFRYRDAGNDPGVDIWRLGGFRKGFARVPEVGCCTDDQGTEPEVGASHVADVDFEGCLLAFAAERAKMLVCRSAVDASAGMVTDQIIDGLLEDMVRYHGGWWMRDAGRCGSCGFCTVFTRRFFLIQNSLCM